MSTPDYLKSPSANSQKVPVAEMVFAAFSFSTMAAIAHALKADVPWPLLAFVRIFVTFIIALCIARIASTPVIFAGPPVMWLRSIIGTVGLMCTFYSVTHLPITDALTIQHTSPLWVAVILAVIHRRIPVAGVLAAVPLGIGGVVIMERPDFDSSSFAMGVALLGAMCTATAVVSLRYLGSWSTMAVVAHYCGFAAIVTLGLCFVPLGDVHITELTYDRRILWVLPMGLFGTFGQVYMTRAMGKGDTQLISLVALSVIVFAAMYDYLLWGAGLDMPKFVGIAFIVLAVALCSRVRERPAPAPVLPQE